MAASLAGRSLGRTTWCLALAWGCWCASGCGCASRGGHADSVVAPPAEPIPALAKVVDVRVEPAALEVLGDPVARDTAEAVSPATQPPWYEPWSDPQAPWPDDGHPTLFTFAVVSDVHTGGPDAASFEPAIDAINAVTPPPAFVLVAGDLTDGFTKDQVDRFQRLRSRFAMPVHVVPGNHDVEFEPTPRHLEHWKRAFPKEVAAYRIDAYAPLTVIGFDSQLFNERRRTPALDDEAERELRAIESHLEAARAAHRRVVLFHHIPPYPNFFRAFVKRGWRSAYVDRYLSLLRTYDVQLEITGHLHRDELYVVAGTTFMNVPPISEKYSRKASYRLVRVTDAGFSIRQVYLAEDARHLSYQMDLHGLTDARLAHWVEGLSDEQLRGVWRYRNAGDKDTEAWFTNELVKRDFRAFLKTPFAYQPAGVDRKSETRYLKR